MIGGTGAPLVIAKLREATDKATTITEGDEATGAASSPLVFLVSGLSCLGQFTPVCLQYCHPYQRRGPYV
jgi:hypothetical protein